jgi:hypothetical protein
MLRASGQLNKRSGHGGLHQGLGELGMLGACSVDAGLAEINVARCRDTTRPFHDVPKNALGTRWFARLMEILLPFEANPSSPATAAAGQGSMAIGIDPRIRLDIGSRPISDVYRLRRLPRCRL